MKWSWRIGRFAGIDVHMHATFLLLLAFVGVGYFLTTGSVTAALMGITFVLALFLCVVLHEYGHALTARGFGIRTRDITLLPIGGVARLERMPEDPVQELWVALAGPAVNVVIAGLLFAGLLITGTLQPVSEMAVFGTGGFFERLMIVNVFLVLFNLLPAFPMDGGRVLRAVLATRMDYVRATNAAASVGQGMALLFGFIGLFLNPFLLLIALFVWMGAAQEAQAVQTKSLLGDLDVRRAMLTTYRSLEPNNTLADAVQLILSGSQQDFPVVYGGRVIGLLTRQKLVQSLAEKPQGTAVTEVMDREYVSVGLSEPLAKALAALQERQVQTLPVVEEDALVGLLTLENVSELIMIRSALASPRQAA